MRDNLAGAIWRLAVFVVVCLVGTFAMFAIFGQLRFQPETAYSAVFSDVSGLKNDDFVRIAGVETGRVKSVAVRPDSTVRVDFTADPGVVLTEGTRAVIRYDNLIGGRYLGLEEGPGGIHRLKPGATVALDHTAPALDLDALIGGFRPLFRALDPDQINALSGQLIRALQGQGPTIDSFLTQTSSLTNTLADRDQLIGEVITNLHKVLGSLSNQSKEFGEAVTSLSQLIDGLAARKTDISNSIGYLDSASASVADLLSQARAPANKVIHETDRTAAQINSDREWLDHLLKTLPDAYQILSRQGLYGDFFSFYLCDIVLKVNGKGGQPVYIKLAGQATGRCTPQ